jgi:hypothetical protein
MIMMPMKLHVINYVGGSAGVPNEDAYCKNQRDPALRKNPRFRE